MENIEIRNRIFEGLKSVFDFYDNMNLETGHFIRPEYLLTVKIAESLAKDNSEHKIKLEERTKDFANCCVENYGKGFSSLENNVQRNGRVDIAVYSTDSNTGHLPYKALFPIEIKNINPYQFDVISDVERNLGFFKIQDPNTGSSKIKLAYNVSIEELHNTFIEDRLIDEQKLKKKYNQWLNLSNLFNDEFEFAIFCKFIEASGTLSKNDPISNCADDYENIYTRFGMIIELTRKNVG